MLILLKNKDHFTKLIALFSDHRELEVIYIPKLENGKEIKKFSNEDKEPLQLPLWIYCMACHYTFIYYIWFSFILGYYVSFNLIFDSICKK